VAGYSGATAGQGKTRAVMIRGAAFLLGAVIAMSLLGALFGFAGDRISASLGRYWKLAAGLILILFGIYSMDLLPFRMPGIKADPSRYAAGGWGTLLFGLMTGGLFSALNSCCNPFFPVILAASFLKGSAVWGLAMLAVFALGYGIPLAAVMVGLGMGLGRLSRVMERIGAVMKYLGGMTLLLMGFYFLYTM